MLFSCFPRALTASLHTAFNVLENEKHLMKRVGEKEYRKREFDTSWLTDQGIIFALGSGVNAQVLLCNTKKVYPKEPLLHLLVKFKQDLGQKPFDYTRRTLESQGFSRAP